MCIVTIIYLHLITQTHKRALAHMYEYTVQSKSVKLIMMMRVINCSTLGSSPPPPKIAVKSFVEMTKVFIAARKGKTLFSVSELHKIRWNIISGNSVHVEDVVTIRPCTKLYKMQFPSAHSNHWN